MLFHAARLDRCPYRLTRLPVAHTYRESAGPEHEQGSSRGPRLRSPSNIKEATGKLVGNETLEAKGNIQAVVGKA
jgi:hypothetical protein